MKSLLYQCLILSAAVLLGWSCEKTTLQLPVETATGGARIKLIHAAPEAPGVDLFIGGLKFSGFTPAGASTTSSGTPVPIRYDNTYPANTANYAIVPAGSTDVNITAPATITAGSATVISTQNLTLENDKYYSLIVAGNGARQEVLVLNDDFSAATDPNKFYVRFINLTSGIAYDLALANGTVLAPALAYKAISPFLAVDATNSASFAFRVPGTTTSLGTITFNNTVNGRVLTVFTRGLTGRTGTLAPGINFYVNR